MGASFEILSYNTDKDGFLSALENCDLAERPSRDEFEIESKYRQAIAGDGFKNLSFAISKKENIEAIVLCHREDPGLTYAGRTTKIIAGKDSKKVIEAALDELNNLAAQENFESFKVSDDDLGAKLSTLGEIAYNRGGQPDYCFEGLIDLHQDEATIHSNLRKSYKSLVNQGDREIDFITIDQNNPDKEKFDAFREFHKKIAGRATRPIESWDAQFDMIKAGCAELIMGEMAPHGLVSAAFCIDHGNTTHYGVAVYDRDLFEKPLGHASVYKSILSAKERGQDIFSLGKIFQKDTVSDKEFNIGAFKKGFCDKLSTFVEWDIKTVKEK